MIISIKSQQALHKIQHPFMIKKQQLGLEENFLNLIKDTYGTSTTYIIRDG